jgi:hypothetical protein
MAAAGPEASMTNPTAINRYIARNSKTSSQDRSVPRGANSFVSPIFLACTNPIGMIVVDERKGLVGVGHQQCRLAELPHADGAWQ